MNASHWSANEIPEASAATTELEEHEIEIIQDVAAEAISNFKSKWTSAQTHQTTRGKLTISILRFHQSASKYMGKKKINQTKEESHQENHSMAQQSSMYKR